MAEASRGPDSTDGPDWRELTAILLLSVTAILTAWTGFQASKWSGAMSISFSQASSSRIQAARFEATADRKATIQVSLFTQWLQAYQAKDEELTTFLAERFPAPLSVAFPAWTATKPQITPGAPETPFQMEEYKVPELEMAASADARADTKFDEALRNNQRGDNYTILTVAFATVLFFTAISGRMKSRRSQWLMLALAAVGFLLSAGLLISFPKLV